MSRSVLVIEDDRDIAQLVKIHVEELHCRVKLAYDGTVGLAEAEGGGYDLIILDLMLPGIDGLEITRRLRAKTNYTPLLMLTAKSSELERVLGLEMGADDYLTKPFSVLELTARVKAIFRRVEKLQAGAVSSESTRILAPCAWMRNRWSLPPRSSTCCCSSYRTPAASTVASSCSITSGATVIRATSTPSTPTSTGCGRRSNATRAIRS